MSAWNRPRTTVGSLAPSDWMLVAAGFALVLAGYCFGEKIEIGQGCGWDGQFYARVARDFYGSVHSGDINPYSIQRILPSAEVHYALRLLSLPLTTPNVVHGFGLLSVALLTLTAFGWCLVANQLGIGRCGKWLGAAGLFVNFAVLKWLPYYPVNTDAHAPALGIFMLYGYLARRPLFLIAVAAISSFVWPALLLQGIFLMVFPRPRELEEEPSGPRFELHAVAAFGVALLVSLYIMGWAWKGDLGIKTSAMRTMLQMICPDLLQPLGMPLQFSTACLGLYLFLMLVTLWNYAPLFRPASWLKNVSWTGLLAAVFLLWGSARLVAWLTIAPPLFTMPDLQKLFLWEAVSKPWISCVAHAVFYGPVIVLAVLRWKGVCGVIHGAGLGLTLCATFNVWLSIDAESRHLLHCFPILLAFVIKAADVPAWRGWQCGLFAALCLACSKVWLTLGGVPNVYRARNFPSQRLFMHFGVWMSRDMYLAQGIAVVLTGCLLYGLILRPSARRAVSEPVGSKERLAHIHTEPKAIAA